MSDQRLIFSISLDYASATNYEKWVIREGNFETVQKKIHIYANRCKHTQFYIQFYVSVID